VLNNKLLVALPCKLSPAAFSGERIFDVKMADGNIYTGVAPRHFCWNAKGAIVGEGEPQFEEEGGIAAKMIERIDDNQIAVEVPDGEVIAVDKDQIRDRPTQIAPPSYRSQAIARSQ
jgi:hypothetical protein